MRGDQKSPAMEQKIFGLSLGVETISTYLLCCALKDGNAPITVENLLHKWQGTQATLTQCLAELEQRRIIVVLSEGYVLNSSDRWKSDE